MNRILITEGDPCGIGPEIFLDTLSLLKKISKTRPIVYFHSGKYSLPKEFVSMPMDVADVSSINAVFNSKISERLIAEASSQILKKGLFSISHNALSKKEVSALKFGKPSALSGKSALATLSLAVRFQKEGGGDLITLPLSKEWVIASGASTFRGHTEFLAEEYRTQTFMLMSGKDLQVLPLTTHVPLVKVPEFLKEVDLDSLADSIFSCQKIDLKKPIVFLGLNPHAGEGGKIGKEEVEILEPMIQFLKKKGLKVEGPLSADSMFGESSRKKFGLHIACYHDQGLIPFKMWEGKRGVNLTLGLPFIRVSPDHGTAFDIAGKGLADSTSFVECLNRVVKDLQAKRSNKEKFRL
ncbi:PdxA family dehydrogenase [Leptospira interrogans]|uniref:PdxA family dehydrogenase n=1 Tax=Leptospira interrogans TaxID=173 RepID=UPI0002BDCDA4|nr:4-hydroxythreonine-4-phosphate dehydrogenase PdxA [Leptospira interrogans]EMJ56911.1 4-hydroxythreonine-4-phosphate dehydrogenase PdxA [Leptospira interrogans serovar Valbuzzi str. Duyster]ENO70174.1 4-hydroxythreonine-4-phosphate dehydrogenase PdxA [Leptospira interrogans serovar Valbuzzi str. Valbuzzi]UMQ57862.1 4-hydroxythreonine-4-phosphate dehydrogenase PdxA [Leptospira interrogans]UNE68074.1 4-hydroxythreonine-4-phosphate dehydrogenase PdxA [Leptospira interrogans]